MSESQKSARPLKFQIKKVEGLYYPFSETKMLIGFASLISPMHNVCFLTSRLILYKGSGSFQHITISVHDYFGP